MIDDGQTFCDSKFVMPVIIYHMLKKKKKKKKKRSKLFMTHSFGTSLFDFLVIIFLGGK